VETSGPAALARLRGGEAFDAVLCDVAMPKLGGIELHRELARADAAQAERFVFMTGGACTPEAAAFLERTAQPVVEKPVARERLHAAIRPLLARRRAPGPSSAVGPERRPGQPGLTAARAR
jgi:CheY-like chemotaxis protein